MQGSRTIFIGDVHGCLDELRALLDKCGRTRDDRIVLVGDLVAKGPDSAGVIELARELCALSVRGNHDEAVLRYRRAQQEGKDPPPLKRTHRKVAESLTEPAWAYLEALPLWLDFPELSAIAVHAGIVPGVALERQREDDLMNMRTLRPDGSASSRIDEGTLWGRTYGGPKHVIFGHNAITGFQQHAFATGLDTGCVYGRSLTALVLPSRELVRVEAKRAYKELEE